MEKEIMPIGKYKGMTVEEIISVDPGYIEWVTNQNWFQEKFDKTYNTIINIFNPQKNECSPEHNKLQMMFLDDKIKEKVVLSVLKEDIISKIANKEKGDIYLILPDKTGYSYYGNRPIESVKWHKKIENFIEYQTDYSSLVFENKGFDVSFVCRVSSKNILVNDILKNIDYPINTEEICFFNRRPNVNDTRYEKIGNDGKISFEYYNDRFFIEIKPSIGDDFPNILRQIKKNIKIDRDISHIRPILYYNTFDVSNLSLQEVEKYFKNEGIRMVKHEGHN
jgi:hypothetical protein